MTQISLEGSEFLKTKLWFWNLELYRNVNQSFICSNAKILKELKLLEDGDCVKYQIN